MVDKPTSSKSRKQRAQAEQVEQTPAPRPQPAEAAQTVEQFVTEKATQAAQKRRVEAALSVLDGAGDDKVRAKALRALLDGSDPEDRKAILKALNKLGGTGQPAAKVNPDDELSKDWKDGGYPYANLLRRSVYERTSSSCRWNCSSCRPGSRKPASAWSSSLKGATLRARAAPSSASWSI